MVDGVHFAEHTCVVALGISIDGVKHPLAVEEGSTKNATLVTDLITGLRDRGLDVTRPILAARLEDLDYGDIDGIAAAARAYPLEGVRKDEASKELGYFLNNAPRMRYHRFRLRGLFVGSGVVEVGCKAVIGQRLKQSGMHWTVAGADSIITLRCAEASSQWEAICRNRYNQTGPA